MLIENQGCQLNSLSDSSQTKQAYLSSYETIWNWLIGPVELFARASGGKLIRHYHLSLNGYRSTVILG